MITGEGFGGEVVVAGATIKDVGALVVGDGVITGIAIEGVVTEVALDVVVAITAMDGV